MAYTYEYPRPNLTVDCVIFGKYANSETLQVLLIQRKHEPFANKWAFPGGFVDENEDLIDAAKRELVEETSLENIEVQQFGTFGAPGRDPRGWTVSVAYYALVNIEECKPQAADDAREVAWFSLEDTLPELAFDHSLILKAAQATLAKKA